MTKRVTLEPTTPEDFASIPLPQAVSATAEMLSLLVYNRVEYSPVTLRKLVRASAARLVAYIDGDWNECKRQHEEGEATILAQLTEWPS